MLFLRVDVGDNSKALLAGLNLVVKSNAKSGLIYSVDKQCVHFHSVVCQAHLDAGLSAVELTKAFAGKLVGGKSGGKPNAAMGSATLQAESQLSEAVHGAQLVAGVVSLSLKN